MRYTLILLLLIVACGSAEGPSDEAVIGDWHLLEGSTGGAEIPIVEEYPITISFSEDGTVGLRSGCNQGGGTYDLVDGELIFGQGLSTTEMACEPDVMASEGAFLSAITQAETASVEADRLVLSGPDARLVFGTADQ